MGACMQRVSAHALGAAREAEAGAAAALNGARRVVLLLQLVVDLRYVRRWLVALHNNSITIKLGYLMKTYYNEKDVEKK